MAQIALFHSALGVRSGVTAAAELLRAEGHQVLVVDQYDGAVFDDYEEASEFVSKLGYPALMGRANEAVGGLAGEFVTMGFSNGGAMAQYVATQRPGVRGAVLLSGAIDLAELGDDDWPAIPAQVHYTVDDPFRDESGLGAALDALRASGAEIEQYDYPGAGHLFTDPGLPEYQPVEAALLWSRVLPFVDRVGGSG